MEEEDAVFADAGLIPDAGDYLLYRGFRVFRPPMPLRRSCVHSYRDEVRAATHLDRHPTENRHLERTTPTGLNKNTMVLAKRIRQGDGSPLAPGSKCRLYSKQKNTYLGEENIWVYRPDSAKKPNEPRGIVVEIRGFERVRMQIAQVKVDGNGTGTHSLSGKVNGKIDRENVFLCERLIFPEVADVLAFSLWLPTSYPSSVDFEGRGYTSARLDEWPAKIGRRTFGFAIEYVLSFYSLDTALHDASCQAYLLQKCNIRVVSCVPTGPVPSIQSPRCAETLFQKVFEKKGHKFYSAVHAEAKARVKKYLVRPDSAKAIGRDKETDVGLKISCPSQLYKRYGEHGPDSLPLNLSIQITIPDGFKVSAVHVAMFQTMHLMSQPLETLNVVRAVNDRVLFEFEIPLKKNLGTGTHTLEAPLAKVAELKGFQYDAEMANTEPSIKLESYVGFDAVILTELKVQISVKSAQKELGLTILRKQPDVVASVFPQLRLCGSRGHSVDDREERRRAYRYRIIDDSNFGGKLETATAATPGPELAPVPAAVCGSCQNENAMSEMWCLKCGRHMYI